MFSRGLVLALVWAPMGFCAISPVGGGHANTGMVAEPPKLTIAYSSSKGNTIAVTCALGKTSSIKAITDSGGSAWTRRASATATGVNTEIWTTPAGGSMASTLFTITPAAPAPMSCAVEEYSGVAALGHAAMGSGNSGTAAISIATQDADNYIVAGIGVGSYNGQSAASGKLRQNGGLTGNTNGNLVGGALTDNTAPAASNVTCSNSFGREPWAAAAIEFRSAKGARKSD